MTDKKEWDWEIPLLEALRGYGVGDVENLPVTVTADLIAHAADEITRLRAENELMRKYIMIDLNESICAAKKALEEK